MPRTVLIYVTQMERHTGGPNGLTQGGLRPLLQRRDAIPVAQKTGTCRAGMVAPLLDIFLRNCSLHDYWLG